jgi:hypothetical protein
MTLSFNGILSPAREFQTLPLRCAALLITLPFVDIFAIGREFQTLPLPSLLLCSPTCPSSAFFPQDVSFRCFLAFSASLIITLSFNDIIFPAREFPTLLPISVALLITLSFVGVLSPVGGFQTLPLPFLHFCSSPCL